MLILIKLPNWLGDTIMLTPSIAFLRKIYPSAKFVFVGNSLSSSVISAFGANDFTLRIFIDDTKAKRGILSRMRASRALAFEINSYLCEIGVSEKNIYA